MTKQLILAIDQGTTSSRAVGVDSCGNILFTSKREFAQLYPQDGWVEHQPAQILKTTLKTAKKVIAKASAKGYQFAAIGITNQRETTLLWDKKTGKCIYNAIVWQDRRTADRCAQLATTIDQKKLQQDTGLLLDPYFSATKIAWILENVAPAKQMAKKNRLAFGTVDSYLIWHLTGGKVHATDATNASRTMLYNIKKQQWDDYWLDVFSIPKSILPQVYNSCDDFGIAQKKYLGIDIPIRAAIGDQQAALVGQACFERGMAKSTYGTGCFMVLNTADELILSNHKLLSTIAYKIDNRVSYALEGSIFVAGAAVQWLRDGLKIIKQSADSEKIAQKISYNHGVYMVPAFTGLGAPYWNPNARGALLGLNRDSQIAHIVRACLESIAYQSHDLLTAMRNDGAIINSLRTDGGMADNAWFLQCLADILDLPVMRPKSIESTALGAAMLAALGVKMHNSLNTIAANWRAATTHHPNLEPSLRQQMLGGWQQAVAKVNC